MRIFPSPAPLPRPRGRCGLPSRSWNQFQGAQEAWASVRCRRKTNREARTFRIVGIGTDVARDDLAAECVDDLPRNREADTGMVVFRSRPPPLFQPLEYLLFGPLRDSRSPIADGDLDPTALPAAIHSDLSCRRTEGRGVGKKVEHNLNQPVFQAVDKITFRW